MLSAAQTQWLLVIVAAAVGAAALSVPPSAPPNASSQKAFDEVSDWIDENFGAGGFVMLAAAVVIAAVALSSTDAVCQWTLLGVASLGGMMLALLQSAELSANEFRAWCLANAGIVVLALRSLPPSST